MKNYKLYKKGKVHPSSLSSSSSSSSSFYSIDDHFSLLPAAILTLIAALSLEDKQVLAYLISCSNSSKKNTQKGSKLGDAGNHGGDHSPVFNCDCFRCYKSFWARWDASPNRQLIHEIIEAYEEDLLKKNKLIDKSPKTKRTHRRRVARVCDEPSVVVVDSGSGQGLVKEEIEAEESPAGKVAGDGADEDGEVGSEKGSTLRRLWGFIGEKVSAVWNMGGPVPVTSNSNCSRLATQPKLSELAASLPDHLRLHHLLRHCNHHHHPRGALHCGEPSNPAKMDALFDSINVRDLLSAHDLSDPSTPLSAPDLRLLIQRLESHSLQIKAKIQAYLLSHHHDFSNLFSLCNDAVSRSDRITGELSDLLRLVSDRPIDAEISDTVKEMNAKMREVRAKRELLELVKVIVEINEKLTAAKEALRNGRLRFAAEELRELKAALGVSNGGVGDHRVDEGEPVVYGLLRKEWSDCFEEIQEVLSKFMANAVRFDRESHAVRVKYLLSDGGGVDRIEFRTVLEALDDFEFCGNYDVRRNSNGLVLGILDYGLAKVADLLIKYVIAPAVNYKSPVSFVEESVQDSKELTEAILKMVPFRDHKVENEGETIYSGILQIIRFFCKSICFQNGSWIQSFGRLMWPRISDLIISNFLSKVVPQDASKLADFQKIVEHTLEFETALKEMTYISNSDNKVNRLSDYAENVEVHFASRKKTEILANARKLLLQCDFAIPQEYIKNDRMAANASERVVNLLFLSERCVVSKAALQLMELVHQTLKDVCLSSTRVALEFYHAARDVLLLYEVVIPVKLERQLEGINQVAVLMHNDCLYLSQEILGLAYEYRPEFPSSIKEHAVFVDLAPRFHVMAEEILQRQIQLVIYNLKEAIDGADGFQNTHLKQAYESAKFSIDQVIFILEKVHIIWEPLLMPSTYRRSMSMVLESVFSRISRDILLIDDMAAEETLQLQRLIHLMLENLSSLLESLAAFQTENPQESMAQTLDDLIPSLLKIQLLDMPLKSITACWESGDLLSSGFTLQEVQDFIKAIFADSPLRKECLWRLENASF
ncbi:RZZ complex, subunit Zw [Trema orientale]|uniref:RZZ complex, subunit Zw n=1 Tax=Trema orientale TaxID=63057 RepID=A0A2P5B750_TREOI|nr:RZZ complex, subunit Zw [Trema orientale]